MTDRETITEDAVKALLAEGEEALTADERQFWHVIRIRPMKWQLPPHEDDTGGFWVVGILRRECLWYNDRVSGFSLTPFTGIGRIAEYAETDDDFPTAVRKCFDRIRGPAPPSQAPPPAADPD